MQPLIDFDNVTKRYTQGGLEVEVLHGISLAIHDGEFIAIMGASGSGKTTLMNLIGCMDRPTTGRYRLKGHDISTLDGDMLAMLRRDTFGFIFQRYNLLSNASALENVEMPAIYAGLPTNKRRERAKALLSRLGLGERLGYVPGRLSGGQQQRVSIARALMNGGTVILADEPTGALDSQSGREVMELLHELHREGHTIILITHDPKIAAEAERLVRIGDGRILEDPGPGGMPRTRPPPVGTERRAETANAALMLDVVSSIKTALRALQVSPVRTALTLLGVIIGVASVVAMLALGNGAREQVLQQIQLLGTNLLLVKPGAPGVRGAGAQVTTLVPSDAEAIARLPNVAYAVPQIVNPVTVRRGNVAYSTTLDGTTPEFIAANNWPPARGGFFTKGEHLSYAPVAVLGNTAAKALFPGGVDPIGQFILVNSTPLRVIGVLSAKGADQTGNDRDDVVITPITTAQARILGQNYLKWITVEVRDTDQIAATQAAVKALLLKRHRVLDSQVQSMTALLENQAQTQQTFTLMLGAVALISLLVGGIGVMNIMLVSVTERTREIGVRMAVGAREFHILLQFVTEALVVCTIGGLIGLGGGLIAAVVAAFFGVAVVFSIPPLLLALASAVTIGLVFGYLPAKRAAGLDPVVALSTE